MKGIPAASIDLIFTDPPYNISSSNKIFRDYRSGRNANISFDFGEWDYNYDPVLFLNESADLLKPTGQYLIFSSEQLYGKYRDWFDIYAYFKQLLVWVKSNPLPEFRLVKYRQATELVLWALKEKHPKSEMHFNFMAQKDMTNVLTYPICGGHERTKHPTQKPLALVRSLLEKHTKPGDLILDPYCGSGTTLVACKELGLDCIGIDMSVEYLDIANQRLAATQTRLF